MTFVVKPVSSVETRPLRQRVLRPHEPVEALAWPHDDEADTLHAGAFAEGGGELVGTATLHREPPPSSHFASRADDATAWRLRGMATLPSLRRQGVGAALVAACLAHARARGGTLVWCNAREAAAPFYERLGFAKHGEKFELPRIGPHFVMSLRLVGGRPGV